MFVDGHLEWVPSRKSELHTLREVVVRDYRVGLRARYANMVVAAYFCQLLEEVVEREHAEPELHDLLRRGLDHLAKEPATRKALLHYERELARLLGIGHDGQNAAAALERAFGRIPRSRQDCLGILNNGS